MEELNFRRGLKRKNQLGECVSIVGWKKQVGAVGARSAVHEAGEL